DPGPHQPAGLVVLLAFGRIADDVIGGGDVLEAFLRFLVVRVDIGVELAGEPAIRPGDLVVAGRLRHAQHLVVILLQPFALHRHARSPPSSTHDHRGRPHEPAPPPVSRTQHLSHDRLAIAVTRALAAHASWVLADTAGRTRAGAVSRTLAVEAAVRSDLAGAPLLAVVAIDDRLMFLGPERRPRRVEPFEPLAFRELTHSPVDRLNGVGVVRHPGFEHIEGRDDDAGQYFGGGAVPLLRLLRHRPLPVVLELRPG